MRDTIEASFELVTLSVTDRFFTGWPIAPRYSRIGFPGC